MSDRYQCDFEGCTKNYADERSLRTHKKDHDGPIHVCKICTHAPRMLYTQIDQHNRNHHKKKKHYSCRHCNKSYDEKYLLDAHLQKKHSSIQRPTTATSAGPIATIASSYPTFVLSQELNEGKGETTPTLLFGNEDEKQIRKKLHITKSTNATAIVVREVWDPDNPHSKYETAFLQKIFTLPQVPHCEVLGTLRDISGPTRRNNMRNVKDSSFYFLEKDESNCDVVYGPIQLILSIRSYLNGYVRGEIDSNSKSIQIRDWNTTMFNMLMESNNMKMILEDEQEFNSRKSLALTQFNDLGPSPSGISTVNCGFGHIYYAYGLKDDKLHLYLGLNKNPTGNYPVLATCHGNISRDHTGLGMFRRANPDVQIHYGIVYYIESEEDQLPVESATILASVLNIGGSVTLNDEPIPFEPMNVNLNIPHFDEKYRQAVRIGSMKLFGKRPNFVVTGPMPDSLIVEPVFTIFPEANRFEY